MSVCSQLTSCCRLGIIGSVAKWTMVTGNLMQSILGPIFIGLGLAFYVAEAVVNMIPFVNVDWFSAPLIATGVFIYLLTMMGCIAAYKELKCLIAVYSITMTLLVVGQIVLLCYGLGNVRGRTEIWVTWAFSKPYLRQPFHTIEANMHCCGVSGADSYDLAGQYVPASCCDSPVLDKNRTTLICDGDEYKSCAEVVPAYLQKLADKIGNRIYYVIGVQIGDVIASSVLFNAATPS